MAAHSTTFDINVIQYASLMYVNAGSGLHFNGACVCVCAREHAASCSGTFQDVRLCHVAWNYLRQKVTLALLAAHRADTEGGVVALVLAPNSKIMTLRVVTGFPTFEWMC